jgi:hypothetical protein
LFASFSTLPLLFLLSTSLVCILFYFTTVVSSFHVSCLHPFLLYHCCFFFPCLSLASFSTLILYSFHSVSPFASHYCSFFSYALSNYRCRAPSVYITLYSKTERMWTREVVI